MHRKKWLMHVVWRALLHRRGKTLLLLLVLALASSLATALGVVSVSMEKRVADEIRNYGANVVILPREARLGIGSGRVGFGMVTDAAYLDQRAVTVAMERSGFRADSSMHLRGSIRSGNRTLPVEGVDFSVIRRLFPWWQVKGAWPSAGEAVIGADLAATFGFKVGDRIQLQDADIPFRVAGIITTGAEEDGLLFLALPELQRLMGREGEVSQVRLLVPVAGGALKEKTALIQSLLPEMVVREVRQLARTSEGLLAKVQLLLMLVAGVVLVASCSSISGTMSTAVLERRVEIGLLKALGGTRTVVVLLFLLEAVLLGLLGGTAGYFFGCGMADFITRSVFSTSADTVPGLVAVSVATSLFLALLGSCGPLLSVFSLDPARSLRGE